MISFLRLCMQKIAVKEEFFLIGKVCVNFMSFIFFLAYNVRTAKGWRCVNIFSTN